MRGLPLVVVVLAVVALASDTARGSAITIDFEDAGDGQSVVDRYTAQGVHISSFDECKQLVQAFTQDYFWTPGMEVVGNRELYRCGLLVQFVSPADGYTRATTTSFSLSVVDADYTSPPSTIEAYDVAGTMIASAANTSTSGRGKLTLGVSAPNIAFVVATPSCWYGPETGSVSSYDTVNWDDLCFEEVVAATGSRFSLGDVVRVIPDYGGPPIAEPSTLSVVLLGIGGVVWRTRRC